MSWRQALQGEPVATIGSAFDRGGLTALSGRWGSSTLALSSLVFESAASDVVHLFVTAHIDDADQACAVLDDCGLNVHRFPALEVLPGESDARMDLRSERLRCIRALVDGSLTGVIVAPIAALMQPIPDVQSLTSLYRVLHTGGTLDRDDVVNWLIDGGYRRATTVEQPGEFALRGDILDVFPESGEPVRIDTFGEAIESIRAVDLDSMGSGRSLKSVDLVACGARFAQPDATDTAAWLPSLLPASTRALLDDADEIAEQARSYLERVDDGSAIADLASVQQMVSEHCHALVTVQAAAVADTVDGVLPVEALPAFAEQAPVAVADLVARAQTARVLVLCEHPRDAARLRELLGDGPVPKQLRIEFGVLPRGFVLDGLGDAPVHVVPWHEVIHRWSLRRRSHSEPTERAIDAFVQVKPDDLVVHRDHGIARFLGLQHQDRDDDELRREECLVLEFAKGSRLYVPASRIELVQRYIGAFKGTPELSTLGSKAWQRKTASVDEAVRDLACELLRVQAMRASQSGTPFPPDGEWQDQFEGAFEFEETPDQRTAIAAVRTDMLTPRPMDRLVCGDVGFGKTEIAVRAAFRAAAAGKQVAVLVPTTVLAEQHERTFARRLAGYPFRVESLSRFKTAAEQRSLLDEVAAGRVDVVVGTHRLLSKDVHFKSLGLVVVDEEQRFGVEHKQRLLGMRATVDVLTLTATPIPRTLHMSMVGLRDISSLQTAPVDRQAVVTEVIPFDERRVQAALKRELARDGQVFVVHNRVKDLQDIADIIRRLAPDARIITGHGQMPPKELEKAMLAFMRHEADVLVCTTIIESGIDIPRANTIIINEADRYGLADLHQLRGRVGRSSHRGYCYLLLPTTRTVNPDARRRLQAMESFAMLGAGFRIALRDLEIRGAGNILGPEQSGHIAAVGYELYCRLLEQAVADLKAGRRIVQDLPEIDPGFSGWLPAAWIPGDARRMDAYRRLARAADVDALAQVVTQLESAYGDVPPPAHRCIDLAEIRIRLQANHVRAVVRREQDLIFRTTQPALLEAIFDGAQGAFRRVGTPSAAGVWECWWRPHPETFAPPTLAAVLRKRLQVEAPILEAT
ncbi:MAG: transcription-repair coupling factor [Phycisphaerales bacterium]|nr:transcription-repair coupling factor [Phycisphaerales bacterium]